ncbi:hypothetical protein AB0E63_35050 [Kribbella sp. NPDC026596]|uniref:hypothetical protein n=1 Tax=Kribbella sp. NPDC026596 TaxID=3155122 RepID=UPI0033D7D274
MARSSGWSRAAATQYLLTACAIERTTAKPEARAVGPPLIVAAGREYLPGEARNPVAR